jgi:hypothetical protein
VAENRCTEKRQISLQSKMQRIPESICQISMVVSENLARRGQQKPYKKD